MKLYNNVMDHPILVQEPTGLASISQSMLGWIKRVKNSLADLLIKMQVGRMQSVLDSMTDSQLEQIGIKRSEIKRYAVFLIENT